MADRYSSEQRSALMAKVKSRNTRIELRVRRLLHATGYRFRVNMKGLPGTPDIAFTKRKKAIFIHGCFWHGHEGCKRSTLPATRREFWTAKVDRNKERDATNNAKLMALGWSVLTIWECEMTDNNTLARRLSLFLGPKKSMRKPCDKRQTQLTPRSDLGSGS